MEGIDPSNPIQRELLAVKNGIISLHYSGSDGETNLDYSFICISEFDILYREYKHGDFFTKTHYTH